GQNYPNPLNPVTTIQFELPEQIHVTLTIYDVQGREIDVLINKVQSPGSHKIQWDARKVASGIYFYSLETTNHQITRKMILLR
ncbi:MAG: T9SS type A sorting domain-containing protein, partial [Nitrosopumilus sp.]